MISELLYLLFVTGGWAVRAASGIVERRLIDPLHHAHLKNYSDHRRVLVRPLMHLGLSDPEAKEEGYPLLYITSAFLGVYGITRCMMDVSHYLENLLYGCKGRDPLNPALACNYFRLAPIFRYTAIY